jgi:hypothetical protein
MVVQSHARVIRTTARDAPDSVVRSRTASPSAKSAWPRLCRRWRRQAQTTGYGRDVLVRLCSPVRARDDEATRDEPRECARDRGGRGASDGVPKTKLPMIG